GISRSVMTRPRFCVRASLLYILGFTAALSSAGVSASEANWTQFRGPRGAGPSRAAQVPLFWKQSSNIVWECEPPGPGRSSPVVSGGRIYVTTALEQGVRETQIESDDVQVAEHVTLQALCLDAHNGKILWRTVLFEIDKPAPVHAFNSWATPTPVIDAT